MKLHIVTLATGVYNIYLNDLINSIFDVLQKELLKFDIDIDINIISDKQYISENNDYNNIIKNHHIINLPYPLVTLNKLLYIYDVYKVNNYDLTDKFIYVDADSYFISDCDYSIIVNDILDNDMVFAISPWVCAPLNPSYEWNISLTENPKYESAGYRKQSVKETFSQTSFFSTTGLLLDKLNNIIYNYAALDLNGNIYERYLPAMVEQAYINKFLDEQLNNNNILIDDCKIKMDKYIFNDYSDMYINNHEKYKDIIINGFSNKVFIIQKMKQHFKDEKRNSDKFNIDY